MRLFEGQQRIKADKILFDIEEYFVVRFTCNLYSCDMTYY